MGYSAQKMDAVVLRKCICNYSSLAVLHTPLVKCMRVFRVMYLTIKWSGVSPNDTFVSFQYLSVHNVSQETTGMSKPACWQSGTKHVLGHQIYYSITTSVSHGLKMKQPYTN